MRRSIVVLVVALLAGTALSQDGGVPYLNCAWVEALPDGDFLYHCRIHVGEVTADRLDLAVQFRFATEGNPSILAKGSDKALLLWPDRWERAAGPSPVWHPAPVRLSGRFFAEQGEIPPGRTVVEAIFDVYDPAAERYVEAGHFLRATFTLALPAEGTPALDVVAPGGDFPFRDTAKEPPPPVVRRGGAALPAESVPVIFAGNGLTPSRVLGTLRHRAGASSSLRFSVDSILVEGEPGRFAVFDGTGSFLRFVEGTPVEAARVTPFLIAGAQILDPLTGTPAGTLAEPSGAVLAARLSADRPRLWLLGTGGIETWSPDSGERVARVDFAVHPGEYIPDDWRGGVITPCGRFAGLSWMDGKRFALDVRDTASGARILRATSIWGAPPLLALLPDGETLVSTVYEWDEPNGVALFDAKTGETKRVLPDTVNAWTFALSPDGKLLATGGGERVQLFDMASGECVRKVASEGAAKSLAFSPDGKILLVVDARGVRTFDPATGVQLGEPDLGGPSVFSPDGTRVATLTPAGAVALWDARTGAILSRPPEYEEWAIARDGSRVAAVDRRGRVDVWETAGGKHLLTVESPRGPLVLSPDGKLLAAGYSGPAPLLFDVDRAEILYAPRLAEGSGYGPAFSPDGRTVAVPWSNRTIRVYDLTTMALRMTGVFENTASHVEFSGDGTKLAAVVDYGVAVADVADGGTFRRLFRAEWSHHLAISPDGTRVVCGEKPAEIRDATTGDLIVAIEASELYRPEFLWSPDGKRVVAIPEDGSILVFDAGTGKLLDTVKAPLRFGPAAFAPDGTLLAVCEKGAVVFFKE
jgi:WD40 repeat protein